MRSKDDNCEEIILDIFQTDYDAEISRAERIDDKASNLFNYTSAIPTVLVGLFTLGQVVRTQPISSGEVVYASVYFLSILLFVASGYIAVVVLRISAYQSIVLERNRSDLDKALGKPASEIIQKRAGDLLDAVVELEATTEQKARKLYFAQIVMAFAVFLVMLSLALLIFYFFGLN